jgi:hypothetical protein
MPQRRSPSGREPADRSTVLRHKVYIGLKIAKSNVRGIRLPRLLKTVPPADHYGDRDVLDATAGNDILRRAVVEGEPFAAGKIGDCELEALLKYELAERDADAFFRSISKEGHELDLLYVNCGVFPRTPGATSAWAETYLAALGQLDLIGVWFNTGEREIVERYAPHATLSRVRSLEPYYHDAPWTAALAGKRVVVVTPFEQTVTLQRNRWTGKELFPSNPDVLPDFDLTIVRSPFSAALVPPAHADWSASLEAMKAELAALEFDVCIVGAGAYSLPLCSFVRSELRRLAVHLGGSTQILFGIRGRRWNKHPVLKHHFNERWIHPLESERPNGTWRLEGSAYW